MTIYTKLFTPSRDDVDGSAIRALAILKNFAEQFVDSVAKQSSFDTGANTIGVDEDGKF